MTRSQPSPTLQQLTANPITPESFAPFGQVIFPSEDGAQFGSDDAELVLDRGTPRFYIMQLHSRGRQFHTITRHRRCTQCLGALASQTWLLGVAPPSSEDTPRIDRIRAFQIPGNCFVKLHVGTWHAGPYFDHDTVDFYNLELSDTNITDHHTVNLRSQFGREFEIVD